MSKVFLDAEYGKRSFAIDSRVSHCFVNRFNRFTQKNKKIKLYYLELSSLSELTEFCDSYDMDFIISGTYLDIDDEHFDASLKVKKRKKVGREPTVANAA